jgi:hypothetical protein
MKGQGNTRSPFACILPRSGLKSIAEVDLQKAKALLEELSH